MQIRIKFILLTILCICFAVPVNHVMAQQSKYDIERRKILAARSVVAKLKAGFARADRYLDSMTIKSGKAEGISEKNILPDGESLLLQPIFKDGDIKIDGVIFATVRNRKILLSLRDFAEILNIAISVDAKNKLAKGWYIREDKDFILDLSKNIVRTDIGEFTPSNNVIIENDDIFVPAKELGKWIDTDFSVNVALQNLDIVSSTKFPIQEHYFRKRWEKRNFKIPEPSLPLGGEKYHAIGTPSIDVATRSTYRKDGSSKDRGTASNSATIKSVGDLAYGTFTTQAQINNIDKLKNVRMTYKQESPDPELLGRLKARKFEIGDVTTARVPLGGTVAQELGIRVTNTDELRTFTTPKTGISGTAFPGWDIELYRNNQLIGFQEIGEDGFYNFENVDLFLRDNNFRLVFYGPQGEIREEEVYIPVNNSLSRGQSVYDVSLSLDGKNAYNKKGNFIDEDEGSLNISALYEKPIWGASTISAGLRSSEHKDIRNTVGNLGFSTTLLQTLVNSGIAIDNEGDMSADLTLRRNFGEHQFINTLDWRSAYYDTQAGGGLSDVGNLRNNFSLIGPVDFMIGTRPRYNLSSAYSLNTDDKYSLGASASIDTRINRFTFNEQILYQTGNTLSDDNLSSITNITGAYGANRFRLSTEYAIKPDSELRSVLARYNRRFSQKLDVEFGVTNRVQNSVTEYSGKIDWQAGFIRLTPTVTYDTNKNFFAGLNTRFGILRDPSDGRIKIYDRNVADLGGVSAFVFLDKDGDGEFNGEDEPIEGVVVKAPQNGGRVITDENGIALFSRMNALRLTDVYIDKDSLQDPTWVSSFEGVSIVPREGYVAEVKFPIHYAGEIDGSIYAKAVSLPGGAGANSDVKGGAQPVPLRGVTLKLYNQEGNVEQSVVTDAGGFYYFTLVPPGRYLLIIDEKSAQKGNFIRPEPQQIEIGYDGTVIYGNDIYVDTVGQDISSEFLADLNDYKARHPHIDFSNDNYDLVLNLGEYNSRLMMSVIWYKLKSRYNSLIGGGELFVPPSKSFADLKSGKHVLRIGLKDKTISDAYSICRSLMARNLKCKVEIFPSYIKQAQADMTINQVSK